MPPPFDFILPTRIIFGPGSSRSIGRTIGDLGTAGRVFLVTDPGVSGAGIADRVREAADAGDGVSVVGTFTEVPSDSDVAVVERASAAARDAEASVVLAVGGGSVMDTAKAVSVVLRHGGSIRDHVGVHVIPPGLPPVVAVPTTAGTGSEVSPFAVIKDRDAKSKLSFVSRHLYATIAVLDPELTTSLPARLTAATGVDALSHAIEAVFSLVSSPITDALAFGAAREIMRSLPKAVAAGDDVDARGRMLIAAVQAGAAMGAASVGVIHALAHVAGARHGVHHGVANGIFLLEGLRWNAELARGRAAKLAAAIVPEAPTVEALLARIDAFLDEVAVPRRLGQVEVSLDAEALDALAAAAAVDPAILTNPRPATPADLRILIEKVK